MAECKATRPRVLCVDDDPAVLAWLASVLADRFDVTCAFAATDGARALAEDGPFDALLCDRAMDELAESVTVPRLVLCDDALLGPVTADNDGGARYALSRDCAPPELVRAVEELSLRAPLRTGPALPPPTLESVSARLLASRRLASRGVVATLVGARLPGMVNALRQVVVAVRQSAALKKPATAIELAVLARACEELAPVARRFGSLGERDAAASSDVARIARDVVATLDACKLAEGVRIVVDRVGMVPEVAVGAAEVEQVLFDLLMNALEAVARVDRVDRAVYVRIQVAPSGAVLVSVSDNGCGIPERDLARVFEPTYTTKPPPHGGGLGLFAVHEIVTRANGCVDVASVEGAQTVVTVVLPSDAA